ncbi:hypothetical protein SAMN04488700_2450 [Carnobacterium iners]|uniref:Uncharacterized protein n=1 Tax=Carnobacterium iners TaxID=1073423 RepID=A0A1X7NRU3_9LACT|nr:hypothetical protein [Carnobacterium iners]SMH40911.1 hypothetical protein SAMN04488700_2450 [Carnobacterium iners]
MNLRDQQLSYGQKSFLKAFEPFVLPKVNQAIIFINQWMNLRDQQLSYIQVADQLEKELGLINYSIKSHWLT